MRKLAAAVALILILAASLPAGATYGTVFVRDWRNMAACQCLTDAWVAPGAYARLSPDGKLMAYEVVDLDLLEMEGTPDDIGSDALIIGPRSWLMEEFGYSNNEGVIYWVFPSIGYRWSRDGRYIYYDAVIDPSYEGIYWETWRLDLATGEAEKLNWTGRVVMDTSPDGRWVIVVQTLGTENYEKVGIHYLLDRDVIAVDMNTGREVLLVRRGRIRTGLSDVAMSFNEQGDKLAVPVRNQVLLFSFDGENFSHYQTLTFDGLVGGAVWDPSGDYLIIQIDTAYRPVSRFHDPEPKSELYWVDLRTGESGPIWTSNFTQEAPWFIPGTRTLAFNSQLGDTHRKLPLWMMRSGKRLPPSPYTVDELATLVRR